MRIYAISDTEDKGGGGKKPQTSASKREPKKPKVLTMDEWADKFVPF